MSKKVSQLNITDDIALTSDLTDEVSKLTSELDNEVSKLIPKDALSGETMPDVPNQKQLSEVVKKIFQAMGGTITSILLFMFCLTSFADVTSNTEWWEINPTNTLGEVVNDLGLQYATATNVTLNNNSLKVNNTTVDLIVKKTNNSVDLGLRNGTSYGSYSTVAGYNNIASGSYTYCGGTGSSCYGNYGFIGGGQNNYIGSYIFAFIGGGYNNKEYSTYTSILGGYGNTIYYSSSYSSILGGSNNYIGYSQYSLASGYYTYINNYCNYSTVFGRYAKSKNPRAFVWNSRNNTTYYESHADGSFNINPDNNIDGFWIGETNFHQHVKNIIKEEGGGTTTPKTIAMFIIDVNVKSTAAWNATQLFATGFELKASTCNFAYDVSEQERIKFYGQSQIADSGSSSNGIDKMKLYVCSNNNDYDTDWNYQEPRRYQYIPNTLSWNQNSHKLIRVVVLVDTSCLIRNPTGNWLNEDNEDLMWCYSKTTTNGTEPEYAGGTSTTTNLGTLWRPIMPVKWFRNMPNWTQIQ